MATCLVRGLCRVPRFTLYFTPSFNKQQKNKKSSQNNKNFKGKKRVSPRPVRQTGKSSDDGLRALLSSVMSNVTKKTRPAAIARPPSTSSGSTVKLSKCCARYAFAISDPFSPMATGVCVPSGQATASHKVTGFVRLDSKIGTAGFAFVAVSPSGARDAPQVLLSGATFSGTAVTILNNAGLALATGVSSASVTNLPYTVDDLVNRSAEDAELVTSRVASIGLSIQYTGTALNQSGMCYLYRDPSHKNVSFVSGSILPMTIASLSSNPLTTVCNFTRDRCSVSDFASNPREMYFDHSTASSNVIVRTNLVYPYSAGESDLSTAAAGVGTLTYTTPLSVTYEQGMPTTIIVVTGQAGQDFHVEYVVHAEYVGNLAAASYTPSDSDVQGAGMVLEAANGIQQRKTSKPDASTWSLMYEGLAYAAKKAVPLVIPIAEKALLSLLA